MRYFKTTTILGLSLLFVACHKQNIEHHDDSTMMTFEPQMNVAGESLTRGTPITAATQVVDMGVFVYNTGIAPWATAGVAATPNVMSNQKVERTPDRWIYAPVKPWQNQHNTIFAYAPFATTNNGITVQSSYTGAPTIRYTVPTICANQPDLMVAVSQEDKYLGVVYFAMEHALACVGFKVKGITGKKITKIAVKGVSASGTLSLHHTANGVPQWTDIAVPNSTEYTSGIETDITVNNTLADATKADGYLMMIPQTLGADAKLIVTVDGEHKAMILTGKEWKAGEQYTYNLDVVATDLLKYLSNDIGGNVIPQEAAQYNFTFDNPLEQNFRIQARLADGTVLVTYPSLDPIAVKPLLVPANPALKDRRIEFLYEKNGEWYHMCVITQRYSSNIRFLSVGYAAMGGATGATRLGTHNPGDPYINGFWPLINRWFYTGDRPGKDAAIVNCSFERFTYYNGGVNQESVDYKNIGNILIDNSIDILFMPFNGTATPSRVQSQEILNWLDGTDLIASGQLEIGETPHRGLIFTGDYLGNNTNLNVIGTNRFLVQALGLTSGQGSGTADFTLAKQDENSVYRDIIYNGPFGNLSKQLFKCVDNDYGWFEENDAFGSAGFVPIFRDARGKVVIAANAGRRIFFHGETQFLQYGGGLGSTGEVWNPNGTYYQYLNRGPYPAFMANLMWWLIERVTLGKDIKEKATDPSIKVKSPTK